MPPTQNEVKLYEEFIQAPVNATATFNKTTQRITIKQTLTNLDYRVEEWSVLEVTALRDILTAILAKAATEFV